MLINALNFFPHKFFKVVILIYFISSNKKNHIKIKFRLYSKSVPIKALNRNNTRPIIKIGPSQYLIEWLSCSIFLWSPELEQYSLISVNVESEFYKSTMHMIDRAGHTITTKIALFNIYSSCQELLVDWFLQFFLKCKLQFEPIWTLNTSCIHNKSSVPYSRLITIQLITTPLDLIP